MQRHQISIEPAIKQSVPIPSIKYADSKKVTNIQQLLEFFPELTVITDGAEQPIPRPKNRAKRKTHYSGKKKDTLFRKKEKTHSAKPNNDKSQR